jgi:plastocyanin
LLNAGERFLLDSGKLDIGSYEYMCIVHPWMVASIVIEESVE